MNRMDEHDDLPAELVDQLRDATSHRAFVPDEVDQRIMAAATAHLSTHRAATSRSSKLRWLPPAAAAACLAMAIVFYISQMSFQNASQPAVATNADVSGGSTFLSDIPTQGDIDGDGEVDIVDAYMLSKLLGDAQRWPDLNTDGVVDQADVALLVSRIVDVSGGAG